MVCQRNCGWLFHFFNFERNYDGLKSKSPFNLLSKNINFKGTVMQIEKALINDRLRVSTVP